MMASDLPTGRIIAAFLKIREQKKAFNRLMDAENDIFDKRMERLSAELLDRMNKQKVKNMSSDEGQTIKTEEIIPTCFDWDKLYDWIARTNMFEALERRVKKTFVTEYMKENKGALPPGVSVLRSYKAIVKKAPSKRGLPSDVEE